MLRININLNETVVRLFNKFMEETNKDGIEGKRRFLEQAILDRMGSVGSTLKDEIAFTKSMTSTDYFIDRTYTSKLDGVE